MQWVQKLVFSFETKNKLHRLTNLNELKPGVGDSEIPNCIICFDIL